MSGCDGSKNHPVQKQTVTEKNNIIANRNQNQNTEGDIQETETEEQETHEMEIDREEIPETEEEEGLIPFKIFCASWALNHICRHRKSYFFHSTMSSSELPKLLRTSLKHAFMYWLYRGPY